MLKRYDPSKDKMVELTQEYFNDLQSQFGAMLLHYSKNCPNKYAEFCNEYKVTKNA